jgi:hypothetical protein
MRSIVGVSMHCSLSSGSPVSTRSSCRPPKSFWLEISTRNRSRRNAVHARRDREAPRHRSRRVLARGDRRCRSRRVAASRAVRRATYFRSRQQHHAVAVAPTTPAMRLSRRGSARSYFASGRGREHVTRRASGRIPRGVTYRTREIDHVSARPQPAPEWLVFADESFRPRELRVVEDRGRDEHGMVDQDALCGVMQRAAGIARFDDSTSTANCECEQATYTSSLTRYPDATSFHKRFGRSSGDARDLTAT